MKNNIYYQEFLSYLWHCLNYIWALYIYCLKGDCLVLALDSIVLCKNGDETLKLGFILIY